jgi:hypothetical protein
MIGIATDLLWHSNHFVTEAHYNFYSASTCYAKGAGKPPSGVIIDVEVTTGETNEGQVIVERIDVAAATTGTPVKTIATDAGYAYGKMYDDLEQRGIDPVIPAKAEPICGLVPLRRFRYDAKDHILRCPRGKILRPTRRVEHGSFLYSGARDCSRCSRWPHSACPKAAPQ